MGQPVKTLGVTLQAQAEGSGVSSQGLASHSWLPQSKWGYPQADKEAGGPEAPWLSGPG